MNAAGASALPARKLRVAVRADASVRLGSGHLMRCAALADVLRARGHEVLFLCRGGPGDMAGWLRAGGHALRQLAPLEEPVRWQDDAAATAAALGELRPDWLIVDHYGLDARWEGRLAALAGKIMVIDDLADRPHACEVLLDQNFYPDPAPRYGTLLRPDCLRLFGPRHALLRGEFGAARARGHVGSGATHRILCSFGGSDAGNATGMAIDAMLLLGRADIAVDIVVGASNPWREQIARRCEGMPQFHFHCQVSNMAELMLGADLCIGAGGSSSWERCCLGLPSLVLAVADNQVEVAQALDAHGCLRYLGLAEATSAPALAQALAALLADPSALNTMAERGAALVDAQGAARVAAALEGAPIRLRRARLADEDQLHAWRNAPEVRAASFDPQPIAAAAHRRWLHALLEDPARHLLVAEQRADPVAVLRYDVAGAEATVSIYLLPGHAGRGLGSAVLCEGTRWLRAALPGLVQVRARIMAGNEASRAAFRKAGYLASGADYLLTLGDSHAALTRTL